MNLEEEKTHSESRCESQCEWCEQLESLKNTTEKKVPC